MKARQSIIFVFILICLMAPAIAQAGDEFCNTFNECASIADHAFHDKDYPKAISYYKKSLLYARDSNNRKIVNDNIAASYNNQGIQNVRMYHFTQAIEDYSNALAFRPNFTLAYINRGDAYCETGDFESAIKDFDFALKFDRDNDMAYLKRGFANYMRTNFELAVSDYGQVIRLTPEDSGIFNDRGTVFYDMADYDHAIEDFDQSIEMKPGDYMAHQYRGDAYYYKGDYDHAIDDYNEAVQLSDSYKGANISMCYAYIAKGNADKAKEYIDLIFSETSNATSTDTTTLTLMIFKDSLESNKTFPDADELISIASEAYEAKDYPKAIVYYNARLLMEPGNSLITYNLATSYMKNEWNRSAIKYFYRYLYLEPNASDKDDVLALIHNLPVKYGVEDSDRVTQKRWRRMVLVRNRAKK